MKQNSNISDNEEGRFDAHLLDDLPVSEDAFGGHERIAQAILHLVQNEEGGKVIALEGGWGSGIRQFL